MIDDRRRAEAPRGALVIVMPEGIPNEEKIKSKRGDRSPVDNSSGGGRYRLEVRAAGGNKVLENLGPVIALVPRDLGGWVDLDGHDLADAAALDEDDEGADAAGATAAFFASLDVGANKWVVVRHVRSRDNVCPRDGEAEERLGVGVISELDEEAVLADVGGHALELECLEAGPAEEGRVGGGELAEVLDEILIRVRGAHGLLLCAGELGSSMLADGLVRGPMRLLAFRRAVLGGHAATT